MAKKRKISPTRTGLWTPHACMLHAFHATCLWPVAVFKLQSRHSSGQGPVEPCSRVGRDRQRRFCKAGDGGAARSKKIPCRFWNPLWKPRPLDFGTRDRLTRNSKLPLEVERARHKREKAGIGDGEAHTPQPQQPQQSPTSTFGTVWGL